MVEVESFASQLRYRVAEEVRDPDTCSIKCDSIHRECSHSEGVDNLAVYCPDLAHSIAGGICNPDVCAIKCDSVWQAANGKVTKIDSIRGSDFAHRIASVVCDPDVGAVKCHR